MFRVKYGFQVLVGVGAEDGAAIILVIAKQFGRNIPLCKCNDFPYNMLHLICRKIFFPVGS